MTEWDATPPPEENSNAAMVSYVLLLASFLFVITGLISVVIAYTYRDDAPSWLQSHYQNQIRIFWISAIAVTMGGFLALVHVGYLVLLLWLVWFLVRTIRGIRYLNLRREYPNPQSWWI